MRYLVTGGCGFIGSHLVETLIARGHEVVVLDDLSTGRCKQLPASARLIVGDVGEPETVAAALAGTDGCFHLAAVASVQRSTETWIATHRTNQTGSINLFDAARKHGDARPLPVVFASSAAVYGDCQMVPICETAPTLPISPYGADKLGSELHGRAASTVFGSRVIGLRFFNVFGPRQYPESLYSGVISIFMGQALAGHDINIHGDGEQTRDFIFVADIVQGLGLAMERLHAAADPYFGVFNLCRGESVSIRNLAEAIRGACGSSVGIAHGPARTGDIRSSLGAPELARRELGFAAQTTLADGLAATAAWFSSSATPR